MHLSPLRAKVAREHLSVKGLAKNAIEPCLFAVLLAVWVIAVGRKCEHFEWILDVHLALPGAVEGWGVGKAGQYW